MMLTRSFTLLLCLCALALRMGGMHAHVAVDHDDSQNHTHFAAFDLHQTQHADNGAHDHDAAHEDAAEPRQHIQVDLDNEALNKRLSADPGIDALLLIATLLCLLLPSRQLVLPPTRQIASPLQRLVHLRPPLRGPPLHA